MGRSSRTRTRQATDTGATRRPENSTVEQNAGVPEQGAGDSQLEAVEITGPVTNPAAERNRTPAITTNRLDESGIARPPRTPVLTPDQGGGRRDPWQGDLPGC